MKKIAIDLDGVVFDSENLYRVYSEIYDTDVNKKDHIVDNTKRVFQDRYDWSDEECKNLFRSIVSEVSSNANLMPGADIVLNKLKDKYEYVIITSRDEFEINNAKEKLIRAGLGDVKIFKNEHHKIDRFKEEQVDYIIDDDETICINAADSGIKAFYFKNNAANRINHANVINVNNWGEIYKYLILKEGDK